MGRRGPAKAPTALTIARGNPGKRALNHDEPELPVADASPPPGLPKRALAEWKRLAPALIAQGVLTTGDLDTFETYVRLVDECTQFEAKIKRVGLEDAMRSGYSGYLLKLRAQKKQYAAELGLTPSSRSGVKKAKAPDQGSAKARRFFGIVDGGLHAPEGSHG